MQPSLNEVSLVRFSSIREARELVSQLIRVLIAIYQYRGVQRVLRVIEGFEAIELADGYPLGRWRNDSEVDEVERSYFKTITAWAPPLERARDGDSIADLNDRYDFTFEGIPAIGLGIAYLTSGMCVSLSGEPRWITPIVRINALLYSDEEIHEDTVSVLHASNTAHAEAHRSGFETRIDGAVSNGEEAWRDRLALFPHLTLGDKVGRTLKLLGGALLEQAVIRFRHLDDAAKRWESGAFDHGWIGFKATPESGPTLRMYPGDRTFFCTARNADHVFSWHLRLTPGAWRLYYEPIEPGVVSVGYLGPKMSTAGTKV